MNWRNSYEKTKTTKKLLSLVFVVLLLVGATSASFTASAADAVSSDGLFMYNGNTLTGVTEKGKAELPENFTIPAEIDGYAINELGLHAIDGCNTIKELTVPQNITFLFNSAITNCNSLKKVNCNSNYSGGAAYDYISGCQSIETFEFGEGITSIPDNACYGLINLKTVIFNDKVVEIGSNAFHDCSNLSDKTVDLSNVSVIDGYAFVNCIGFENIYLSEKTVKIGTRAFYGCSNIKLTELTIPAKVEAIGNSAFADCSSLKKVNFNSNKCSPAYDYLADCIGIETFEFSEGVTIIPTYACYGLKNLETVVINGNITEIEYDAFKNTSNISDVYLTNMTESM